MSNTIKIMGQTSKVTECIECGVIFTVPLTVYEKQKRRGGYHHCPNGHGQGWSKDDSEEARTRRERDRLKQNQAYLEQSNKELRDRTNYLERSRSAIQGHLTRTKKRVAAGVCPCCNRSFQNLHRHMESKHPDYGDNVVSLKEV